MTSVAGIHAFGAYVPRHRLSRSLHAAQWGLAAARGERAVANFDEDVLTMAAEASAACLGAGRPVPRVVYLATTSPLYEEKSTAASLVQALDLGHAVEVHDVGRSLGGGVLALVSAARAAAAGTPCLVAISEQRYGAEGSAEEAFVGDAAVALLLGPSDGALADVEGWTSWTDDYLDRWRLRGETEIRVGDPRFSQVRYEHVVSTVLGQILDDLGIGVEDVSRLCLAPFDGRLELKVAKALGFEDKQMAPTLLDRVGHAGAAGSFLCLAAAADEAQPGDRIIVVGYGDGAAAVSLLVGETASAPRAGSGLGERLEERIAIPHSTYFTRIQRAGREVVPEMWTSPALLHREAPELIGLQGSRCAACGAEQYPAGGVCPDCGASNTSAQVALARRGTVLTYTADHLYPSPTPPTISAIVDLEGGARFFAQFTADTTPDEVTAGMRVEMTLRRLHLGRGFANYFWKLRPAQRSDHGGA